MEIKPVAVFKTRKKNPYEAARQSTADLSDEIAEIHFLSGEMFEQALDGIEGFSHLWLLYQFHHNQNWKPKVLPPRGSQQKVGVFATRSPYRPNALGLSCVELVERNGLILRVRHFDLLDETPIFDIKPYVSYADSFPNAKLGWLEGIENEKYEISFSFRAQAELQKLVELGITEISNFLVQQLSYDPLNSQKKRVQPTSDLSGILAYRTWRTEFHIQEKKIEIQRFFSGYTSADLQSEQDPYQDKNQHRLFIEWQNQNLLRSQN